MSSIPLSSIGRTSETRSHPLFEPRPTVTYGTDGWPLFRQAGIPLTDNACVTTVISFAHVYPSGDVSCCSQGLICIDAECDCHTSREVPFTQKREGQSLEKRLFDQQFQENNIFGPVIPINSPKTQVNSDTKTQSSSKNGQGSGNTTTHREKRISHRRERHALLDISVKPRIDCIVEEPEPSEMSESWDASITDISPMRL